MTSSPTVHQAPESPSKTADPERTAPVTVQNPAPAQTVTGVTAPPLRVTGPPPGPRPTLSTTGRPADAGDYSAGETTDPVGESPTGSRSSDDAAPVELPLSLDEVAAAAVTGAALAAAHLAARGDGELEAVLAPTDDETAAIAGPLGKVAKRRIRIAAGSTDGGDLVAAGLAALVYVIRAGWAAFALVRTRRNTRKATGEPKETEPKPEGMHHE